MEPREDLHTGSTILGDKARHLIGHILPAHQLCSKKISAGSCVAQFACCVVQGFILEFRAMGFSQGREIGAQKLGISDGLNPLATSK